MFSRTNLVSARRYQQHSDDFFPILSSQEIAVCLQSCNINVTEENLAKPTALFTQHLFVDLIPPEFLSTTLDRKLERFQEQSASSEDGDTLGDVALSLPMIALQKELYEFMKVCGINDFNFLDIHKPDAFRLRRILSAVVNFARFKYERSNDYQELIDISEAQLIKRNKLIDANQQLASEITFLQNKHGDAKEKIAEINEYQSKIQRDLKELKSIQDRLSQEHSDYKQKRNELIAELEQQNENIINTTKENEDMNQLLAKIDVKNPENTKNEINSLKQELADLRIQLTGLDEKSRRLQITIDTIKLVGNDVESLLNLVNTIKTDMKASKEHEMKLSKYNDANDYKNSELQNLDKKIQQLQQQIDNVNEKITRYSNQRQERNEKNMEKMEALQQQYNTLMNEKKEKDKLLNEKTMRLSELEHKIKAIVSEYEEEMSETQYEIRMLWLHIELYMKKMSSQLRQ